MAVYAYPTPTLPPPRGEMSPEGPLFYAESDGGTEGVFARVFCLGMMFLAEMNYSNKPCSIALAIALVRLDTLSFSYTLER